MKRLTEDCDVIPTKFLKVDTLEEDQMHCKDVGTVVNVTAYNHSHLGSQARKVVPIFVREDVKKLWAVLDGDHNLKMVNGPPGVGKSTVVWAWARCKAMNTKVYWVHVGRICSGFAVLDGNKVFSTIATLDEIRKWIAGQEDGILIADGVTDEMRKELLPNCCKWFAEGQQNRKFVMVSSESLRFV